MSGKDFQAEMNDILFKSEIARKQRNWFEGYAKRQLRRATKGKVVDFT